MLKDRPFRHLCPEADLRDAMTDDEFWEHVFYPQGCPDSEDEWEPDVPEVLPGVLTPCPECGEYGACGYDDQGRALIHVTAKDEDE